MELTGLRKRVFPMLKLTEPLPIPDMLLGGGTGSQPSGMCFVCCNGWVAPFGAIDRATGAPASIVMIEDEGQVENRMIAARLDPTLMADLERNVGAPIGFSPDE
jgi:hypothetical protein